MVPCVLRKAAAKYVQQPKVEVIQRTMPENDTDIHLAEGKMPQEKTKQKILIAVAWPYCNGDLHIGHIAGAYLPPDIFARYQRLKGNDVLMVSGSDTHGTPITVHAKELGISPREVVDRYHPRFIELFQKLGISFDLFTETDTENHWAVTQDFFLTHWENGYIYKGEMQQLFCLDCQKFLADRYVEGTCPYCGYPHARGDQCDNCGRTLDPTDLIDPHCKICGGTNLELRSTEHFFLDLGKLNEPLKTWINDGKKDHWRPSVFNFTKTQLEGGELRGRPITRDISWGIPVPLPGYEHKRIYVWYDAVIGYLAASKEWSQHIGRPEAWREWWQDEKARSYYFIGKDNIPFHTIIWPAMLYGYGGLNLPYDVPANEYLNVEGKQLSKSRHWVVEALDVLGRYDPDPWRYVLAANFPETQDIDFTWEEFVRRNNAELVATWGNLANRVLSFAYKRFDGQVPTPRAFDQRDKAILAQSEEVFERVSQLLDSVKLRNAITEVMGLAHEANRYLNDKEPWKQIKVDQEAAATTIYTCLQVIDRLKVLFLPFLPFSSQKLHEYLGYDGDIMGRQYVEEYMETKRKHLVLRYDGSNIAVRWELTTLPAGQPLRKPAPLFSKLEASVAAEETARMIARLTQEAA